MAVPGLLIEYLINGAIALIWIFPFAKKLGLFELSRPILIYLALGLYFVGMVIDLFAWLITKKLKRKLRTRIENKYGFASTQVSGSSHVRQAKFALYAPEIAKESNMRSSRDRIARGAIINSILITIFVLDWLPGLLFIAVSLIMWAGFEMVSYGFEINAEKILDEKLKREQHQ